MGKDVQKGLKHIQQRQPPAFKRHNDTSNECWPDRERSWPSWCCLFQGLEAFEAQDVTKCAAKTSSAPIKSCKLACETSNKGSRLDSVSRARPDVSDSHNCWRHNSRQTQTLWSSFLSIRKFCRNLHDQTSYFSYLLYSGHQHNCARFKTYINQHNPHFGQLSPFFLTF